MKKLIAIATVMVFVFAASGVYACGEKNSSAKASKASYNSECGSEATKASTVEPSSDKVEATTANYKANTVDSKGCCPAGVKAEKANVKNADTINSFDKTYCPASKEYREIKDSGVKVNKMKAEKSTEDTPSTQSSVDSKMETLTN